MNRHLIAYLKTLGVPRKQAEASLEGWTVSTAKRDGKDCALVLVKGTEIHMVSLGGPAMTRKNTLEYLAPIHEQFGFVTTRVPVGETNDRLRSVLGFTYQWACERFRYFAMTDLPFSKAKT